MRNFRWQFDEHAMTLSYGGIVVCTLLCDEQCAELTKFGIGTDAFIEAQEAFGNRLADHLNAYVISHPLALVTAELPGKQ